MPGIARRMTGALPVQARLAFEAIPIAAQIALDFLVAFAHIAAAAFPAVAIGGGIFVIGDAPLVVGTIAILFTPIGILGGGIHRFGDAFAGQPAGHCADDRANSSTGRTRDR